MVMEKVSVDRFIQSRRKTIGLEITSRGELVVRAPYSVNRNLLQSFLDKKAGWIVEKKALAQKRSDINRALDLETSNKILFLGKYFPVKIYRGNKVFFDQGFFVPQSDAAGKRRLLLGG
ncbi:MAG: YgjP-like metallopeptidase domain-containing protein [Actinomycetota bacterium]|nr:YgjP-like metallopeptidase domain-containing protein [Actinomycetota bacterium]